MDKLVWLLLACVTAALVLALIKLKKNEEKKHVFDLVSSVLYDSHGAFREDDPFTVLWNTQHDLNIEPSCRITLSEKDYIEDIVLEYKKILTCKFFADTIKFPKSKYYVRRNDFILYTILLFCESNWRENLTFKKMYYVTYVYCSKTPLFHTATNGFLNQDQIRRKLFNF